MRILTGCLFIIVILFLCACNGRSSSHSGKDTGSVVVPNGYPTTSDTPFVADSTRIDSTIKASDSARSK